MRKLKTLIHYLGLVELRSTLPFPKKGRLRWTLYIIGLLLLTFFLMRSLYVPLREMNELLIDSGQVRFAEFVDFRLSILFITSSFLALYILIHRFFWDKDIIFLNCLPISMPVLLIGLLSRSAIMLAGVSIYMTTYLSSLITRSPTVVYLPYPVLWYIRGNPWIRWFPNPWIPYRQQTCEILSLDVRTPIFHTDVSCIRIYSLDHWRPFIQRSYLLCYQYCHNM